MFDRYFKKATRIAGAAALSTTILAGTLLMSGTPAFADAPLRVGGAAQVNNVTLDVRAAAGPLYDSLGETHAGQVVGLVAGPMADTNGDQWFKVQAPGITGWVPARFLIAKDVAAPAGTVQQERIATSFGQRIVDIAMQYRGRAYRFGATGPYSFDCSGFTAYVLARVGIRLPHSAAGQMGSGPRVSMNNLQPGDLVFFANTYMRGISHVGIYIGSGKFINAENPSSGVQVSSLHTAYWAAHYAGAVRPR